MKNQELAVAVEALLFVSAKPVTEKKLAVLTKSSPKEIRKILETLHTKHTTHASGMRVVKSGTTWQMVTTDTASTVVAEYIKDEVAGDLSKPSLEALSVIAYRGPITRAEIEELRGVNCAIIIRNLLIRGLIEEVREKRRVVTSYQVTVDFLKYLGIERVSALPNYASLKTHEVLTTQPTKKE